MGSNRDSEGSRFGDRLCREEKRAGRATPSLCLFTAPAEARPASLAVQLDSHRLWVALPRPQVFVEAHRISSCGMWDQGLNPGPLHWELGDLSSGLPGKFL